MARTHDHDLVRSVGARLAAARKARALTQEAVAELAGVDPQTVQRAEAGRVSLSLPRLKLLADALGVPMTVLFDVAPEVPAAPWDPDDARIVALWRRVPPARRELALRVLGAFAR
jgi:transcriptional regulator with XRE-family HTH domain